jgi:glycosyltransferase involved in cell wall biosynthesis
MKPKVSVIVPCYNYGGHVEKCIMSILLQKLDYNIEIVIGDDNSSDYSLDIITRMKGSYEDEKVKFKIIGHDQNIGEINNTRSLLENSDGEYIAYLDADDYWVDPFKLIKQIEFMDNNKEFSMCITGQINFQNGVYSPASNFSSWLCPINPEEMSAENLSTGNFVGSSSSRFFRNYPDIIKDYFYEFPYSDWPMNFELSLRGRIKYLDFPGYVYLIHDNSLSRKKLEPTEEELKNLYYRRVNILKDVLIKHNTNIKNDQKNN